MRGCPKREWYRPGYRHRPDGLLLDMPKVFEDFVAVALREELERSYGGRVHLQLRRHLDVAGRVEVRPGLVWHAGDGTRRWWTPQVQG